ncbi:MAG: hypothetical protein IJO94_07595 [Firmicutes bacterium]|nr:hypothetical protein [Bacillota bacterium]MBQ6811249.1 hypothetical protein [Bacillota bacterium]
MRIEFFDEYTRSFDEKDVLKYMKMPEDHSFGQSIAALLERTDKIAKPKAFYMECKVEENNGKSVTIDGHTFHSAILCKKLKDKEIVYPYLQTCGKELADYANTLTDMVEQYAFDAVMEFYMRQIKAVAEEALNNEFPPEHVVASSSPGSLIDWHISQQQELFALFGDAAQRAGVSLTPSYLMFPVKSVSGIRFEHHGQLHDCEICQKKNCPGRKVPFNMKALLAYQSDEDGM